MKKRLAPSGATLLKVTGNCQCLEVKKKKKRYLRVWRIWRLFPIFHGASFSRRRRCNPAQAAEKVSSPHFRSTRAESKQQHKKEKALTGIHTSLSTCFIRCHAVNICPSTWGLLCFRPVLGVCRLFQTPRFWGGTWILLTWCIRKQRNWSTRENTLWLHQQQRLCTLRTRTFYE